MSDTAGSTLADWERVEIARANESDLTPVVFVHGLWLLSSSWQAWRDLFEDNGYITLAPGWPDDQAAGAPLFQAAFANFNPFGGDTAVDSKNPERGPLLIIGGELDHTVPPAIMHASYKIQSKNPGTTEEITIPDRGHSLTIDSGWRVVADEALAFVQRFVE